MKKFTVALLWLHYNNTKRRRPIKLSTGTELCLCFMFYRPM